MVEEITETDNPKSDEEIRKRSRAVIVAETKDREASPQRRHVVIGREATPRTVRGRLIKPRTG